MRVMIGSTLLSSKVAQPTQKPFELYDSRLPGFTLLTAERCPLVLRPLRP